MELQGTHQFKAPLSKVWEALLDPTVLAKALPGGDQLERVGENDYKAAMNVRVGPVQGRFEGQVTLSEIVEHEGYRLTVTGSGAAGFLSGDGTLKLEENEDGTLLTYAGDVNVGGRIASVGQRLIDSTAKSIIRQGFRTLDEQLTDDGKSGQETRSRGEAVPVNGTPASTSNSATAQPERATGGAETPSASTGATAVAPAGSVKKTDGNEAEPTERVHVGPPSPTQMGRMAVDIAKDVAQDLASDYIPRDKQPQVFAFVLGALSMLFFIFVVRLVQRD